MVESLDVGIAAWKDTPEIFRRATALSDVLRMQDRAVVRNGIAVYPVQLRRWSRYQSRSVPTSKDL